MSVVRSSQQNVQSPLGVPCSDGDDDDGVEAGALMLLTTMGAVRSNRGTLAGPRASTGEAGEGEEEEEEEDEEDEEEEGDGGSAAELFSSFASHCLFLWCVCVCAGVAAPACMRR